MGREMKMTHINNGDFIELDYTGRTKDENIIFDTTIEQDAKAADLHSHDAQYMPAVICVGERHVVPGLDKELVGKEIGQEYTVELAPEDAFGKKDAKLLQLIPSARFRKENVQPMPGMQVNIDNSMGIIKTVSGGRTLVDFNHPLSGKRVVYKFIPRKLVEDDLEKVKVLLKVQMGLNDVHMHESSGEYEVVFQHEVPEQIVQIIEKKVQALVPSVKKLRFAKPGEHKHDNTNEHTAESNIDAENAKDM